MQQFGRVFQLSWLANQVCWTIVIDQPSRPRRQHAQRNIDSSGNVAPGKFRRRCQIDDCAAFDGCRQSADVEHLVMMAGPQNRRALFINPLHHRKVLWRFWLIRQNVAHEFFFICELQCRVKQLLITNSGRRNRPQSLSTSAAGTVRGPDLQVVGKCFESCDGFEQIASPGFGRTHQTGRFFQQVRPAD